MKVFFYGLFMDLEILKKNGIYPDNIEMGYLEHYTLKIGNRASLIPAENNRAYGLLMDVDEEKIIGLYSENSVADYVPEEVSVVLDEGGTKVATCYNLPIELMTGTNSAYATALLKLAKKLDFPTAYLKHIESFL